MRISIIGGPGSGKSYLAKKISEKFGIKYIELDRFWFEAGGLEIYKSGSEEEKNEVRAFVKEKATEAIKEENWVSDGMFRKIQPEILQRADTLVLLDIPVLMRLKNHALRMFRQSERHKEVGMKEEFSFFIEILQRQKRNKDAFKEFSDTYNDKIVILKNRKQINDFLENYI